MVERGSKGVYRTKSRYLSSLADVTNPGQVLLHDCSSSSASCLLRYLTVDVGGYENNIRTVTAACLESLDSIQLIGPGI